MSRGALPSMLSLSSRGHRRVAVVIVLTITGFLGALVPQSYHGLAIAVVLLLAALDVRLIRATGGLAFTRRTTLDEREAGLRDLAYRRGFRLLGLALAVELIIIIGTWFLVFATPAGTQLGPPPPTPASELSNVITGRGLVVIVELLVMLPTLMIAWVDGDHLVDDGRTSRRGPLLWLTLPGLAGGWLLLLTASPQQAVAASNNWSSFGLPGASCAHFVAGRMVGSEFGATVGMRVEVCWNGTDAFVFGDPTIPLPPSAIARMNLPADPTGTPASFVNPALTDLTACGADNLDDFAALSGMTCTATIDTAGALHYTVRANVSALPGVGQHDVTLRLVVARDGRVLERP